MPVWVKLTPTTTNIAKEAEAAFKRGADAISSSNTFTSLPPIDPESLEFEVQRRGQGLVRRARRPGDPAAVARQDGADDDGVSRQELFRDRRHRRVRARAELFPARLRHRAGLHGGDARSRDRPERDQGAARRACRRSSTVTPTEGWHSLDDFRGLRRDRIVAHREIKRPDPSTSSGQAPSAADAPKAPVSAVKTTS